MKKIGKKKEKILINLLVKTFLKKEKEKKSKILKVEIDMKMILKMIKGEEKEYQV